MSAPPMFFLRLYQGGLSGGIMGTSDPNATFVVSRTDQSPDELGVTTQVASANINSNKNVKLDDSGATHVNKLLKELREALDGLPIEDPPGSHDIYEYGIGIQFGLGDPSKEGSFSWQNGGGSGGGCDTSGNSITKATESDKERFRKAVEIAAQLAALSPDAEQHLQASVLSFI
ncbi:hypothetical protein BKA70DRAFT_1220661 [Coprinopsis sp. MPI-PUGE-AT-0042]|nr:hypothetical protein BKA70DRAFT_1220661 [Coprinopsis sp. MPI-PUGE-AT-0042]